MWITAEILSKRKPIWALEFLAYFPFDRNEVYGKDELEKLRNAIIGYIKLFTYKQRNAVFRLVNTHDIHYMPLVITITPKSSDKITIAITFSDEKPVPGKCCICGCDDNHACFNPDYGNCWWIDRKHTLCSHCTIEDIVNHPGTLCPDND